jgi:hypothetical protein
LEAADGALWIAGLGQEAVRVDLSARRWLTYEDLHFAGETPDGARWFVAPGTAERSGGVVRHDSSGWFRYGPEDGLMDWLNSAGGPPRGEEMQGVIFRREGGKIAHGRKTSAGRAH